MSCHINFKWSQHKIKLGSIFFCCYQNLLCQYAINFFRVKEYFHFTKNMKIWQYQNNNFFYIYIALLFLVTEVWKFSIFFNQFQFHCQANLEVLIHRKVQAKISHFPNNSIRNKHKNLIWYKYFFLQKHEYISVQK